MVRVVPTPTLSDRRSLLMHQMPWPARLAAAPVLLLAVLAAPERLLAQDTLKFINMPGGGQVVYGTVDNKTTAQSAMAFMLQQVHGHFADRPQVSKIFQVRNTTSYAAFFTLIAKNDGNRPIAGEVIVSMPEGGKPIAAVLYDNSDNFTRTQPVMLRKLNDAWHTSNPVTASTTSADSTAAVSAGVQPLHRVTGGDRSVYISIPDGWRLLSIAGGSVTTQGPNGERVGLNLVV